MAQPRTPKDLSDWMKSVEERLTALATAARSRPAFTSVDGDLDVAGTLNVSGDIELDGTLRVNGGDVLILDGGDVVIKLGPIGGSRQGLVMYDDGGDPIVVLGHLTGSRHGMEVNDGSGTVQVRLGELASGGYGLEQIGTDGTAVPLATLAYGVRADSAAATVNPGDTGGSWVTASGGPSVSVKVGSSGRLVVTVGAYIGASGTSGAAIGYDISGPDHVAADQFHAAMLVGAVGSIASSKLISGLDPGTYTVEARYQVSGTGAFANRFLIAQPY